jgi:hypothetical protein
MMALGRARGVLLRFVRRRGAAIIAGVVLAAPAIWIEATGRASVWWIEGLALVAGATGAALIWAGISGARPDWVDTDGDSR